MALTVPPPPDAVTGNLTGVMTRAQIHMSQVAIQIGPAVRAHHAQRRAGEVRVEGFQDFLGVELPRPVAIPQQLLLLGVDAQQRIARLQIFLFEPGTVLELRLTVRLVSPRGGFLRLALHLVRRAQQVFDDGHTHRRACSGYPLGNLFQR